MRALIFLLLTTSCWAQSFFPPDVIPEEAWYSAHLQALQEVPLYVPKLSPKVESYRFTWLRTFHAPVALRVDVESDSATLTVKIADGKGGYEPGKLVQSEKKKIDGSALSRLRTAFTREKVFDLRSVERVLGADGAEWVVEIASGGRYHVVSRWSPNDGPVHRIGLLLIELANRRDLVPVY